MTKECIYCKEDKPLAEYYKASRMKSGYANDCKKCRNTYGKKYRKTMIEKGVLQPSHSKLKEYGIGIQEYREAMSTSNKCQACGSDDNLCYDHDHITSKFRGVLCGKCNTGIGMLGDNIQGVQQALNYLKEIEEEL